MSNKNVMTEAPPEDTVPVEVQEEPAPAAGTLPDSEPEASILPDVDKNVDALKAEMARIKAEYEAKESATRSERERYDKMIADTQKRMHEATQALADVKKNAITLPPMEKGETFEEYREKLLEKYENDPKEGIKKLITDFAVEMEAMRATTLNAVRSAEEKAYRKALEKIPGFKEKMQRIKDMDEQHPELADLPEEKKMAILDAFEAKTAPDASRLTGTTGANPNVRPRPAARGKEWLNDPEIQRQASGYGFTSKAELERYASMVQS